MGITANFNSLSRYGNIIYRVTVEKLDGAFFDSFACVWRISQLGVEPIARPVNVDYLIIQNHQGRIEVESKVQVGSVLK